MICAANGLPCFKDLIAVLLECFSIISLGYLSCRFKLVSSQAKDLNSYLTTIALPMIIFLNIAQMEFRTINLSFLLCVLAAKLLVFLTVTLLTLTISYPTNFGYAGSLSILATQSNDFALGYPLIKLLYGESRPEMLNYLSLMAPIQLLILNPLGIAMLEFQKSKNHRRRLHRKDHHDERPNNHNSESDNNNNNNNGASKSPEGRACCQPYECSNLLANSQQSGELAPSQAGPTSHSSESTKTGSPTRLLRVADLLQTGLISQQPKAAPQPQTARPGEPLETAPKTGLLAPRLRKSIHDDEKRRLKFRQKNVRSLVLALPARELLACQQQSSESENELRQANSAGSGRHESLASSQRPSEHKNSSQCAGAAADGFAGAIRPSCAPAAALVSVDRGRRRRSSHAARSPAYGAELTHKSQMDLSFFKALATNPLILASIVALLVNLLHGPELPKYITRVSNTIAASFAAPALFVVGLSMCGKFELLLRNPRDLLLSSIMVLAKGLLFPSLVRTITLLVVPSFTAPEEVPYLVDFAFLYGLLPTAPTACIIAKQYGVLPNVVSISMLLSTIMAGPLTLFSSVIISPTSVISVSDIENVITQTMETSAVLTLLLAPLSLYALLKARNSSLTYRSLLRASRGAASDGIRRFLRANPIRVFVLLLALSQIMVSVGGLLWFFIDTTELNDSSQYKPGSQLASRMAALGSHNLVDLLDDPSNESTAQTTTPEPQIYRQLHTSRMLSPRRSWLADHHIELGYKTLSSLRYVFSAGGLMMAQFCTLSLVSVIAITKLRDHATARRVSEVLLKACFSVLVCLVVWLVYDSGQSVHLPVEASLPSSTQSLCVRLLYNVAILAVSLPLFALLIRTDNRSREATHKLDKKIAANIMTQTRASSEAELEVSTFVKRRFVTSSASLTSEASSAATSNTNLDSTLSSGPSVAIPMDGSAGHAQPRAPTVGAPDTKLQETTQGPVSLVEALVLDPDAHAFRPGGVSSLGSPSISDGASQNQTGQQSGVITDGNNNEPESAKDLEKSYDSELHHSNELNENEFNQYSILIVFMIINTALNLFSVAQKLLHEEPIGTFRQVEIVGIALDFGQGLLTFLIYGTKGLFDWLSCNNPARYGRDS